MLKFSCAMFLCGFSYWLILLPVLQNPFQLLSKILNIEVKCGIMREIMCSIGQNVRYHKFNHFCLFSQIVKIQSILFTSFCSKFKPTLCIKCILKNRKLTIFFDLQSDLLMLIVVSRWFYQRAILSYQIHKDLTCNLLSFRKRKDKLLLVFDGKGVSDHKSC